jgi:hypothetical protein
MQLSMDESSILPLKLANKLDQSIDTAFGNAL